MSKPINPFAIGSFTVGALVLLITGLFIFGGGQLFNTADSTPKCNPSCHAAFGKDSAKKTE